MNGMRRGYLIAGTLVGLVLQPSLSKAQYSTDYQTNFISGVISNWPDSPSNPNAGYVVGSNWVYDALVIDGGGALSNGYGYIGYAVGADNNSVLVSDPGSVWSNNGPVFIGYSGGPIFVGYSGSGNQLTITNGGAVYDSFGILGENVGSSNNMVLVSGAGSVWKNSGGFAVGYGGSGNRVFITDGGAIYSSGGNEIWSLIGGGGGNSNLVLISGSGSVWSNNNNLGVEIGSTANLLIISNGGAEYSSDDTVVSGSNDMVQVTGHGSVLNSVVIAGSDNRLLITDGGVVNGGFLGNAGLDAFRDTALVSGTGSVWSNNSSFWISRGGIGNQLVITNGGAVYDHDGYVGYAGESNVVLVSGNGATWRNLGNLYVGYFGAVNQLDIGAGGSAIASNACIGLISAAIGNQILVTGGALYVTNAQANGSLEVRNGTLTISNGIVTVEYLLVTNGPNATVSLNGGTLSTKGTTVNNGSVFKVGNGSTGATLTLAPDGAGFHSFADGLAISGNGVLNGIGTIMGATTVNAGGTLAPGDGPGSITFSNNLTLAAGSTFAVTLNGTGPGQYDQIIGLGSTISISNCVLKVRLGYTPLAGDSFTIISNFTSTAVLGTFVTTDGAALPNGAEFRVSGTTFEVDYAANCDGSDVTLMALIPEPFTFLLTALGTVSLATVLRCKRS